MFGILYRAFGRAVRPARRGFTPRNVALGVGVSASLVTLFGTTVLAEQTKAKLCKEIRRETLAATRWLAFKQITYLDPNGAERVYQL